MVLGESWQIDGLTYVVGNRGLEAAFPYTDRQWTRRVWLGATCDHEGCVAPVIDLDESGAGMCAECEAGNAGDH
jgi:hypothetical protein